MTTTSTDATGEPGTASSLLQVNDLRLAFGGLHALDGASISVERGRITGLIGPNGAGKTTLFNVVSGALQPDSGQVLLDGDDITGLPSHQIFRRGLCRTFQIPREHGSLSVLENLMLVPRNQTGEGFVGSLLRPGRVRAEEHSHRKHAEEVLEFLQLTHLAYEYARNLSGGQKKLLELARTLMAEPKLVLLDEPGAGVNPTLMDRLRENIERLNRERGITFVLIEHDMGLIMRLCDPVIVMSEGRYLVSGSPDQVRNDQRVLEAYLGGQYAAAPG